MMIPVPPPARHIVSIQVQTTKLTGAGVEIVEMRSKKASHWSLYLRWSDGTRDWLDDIPVDCTRQDGAYTEAVMKAAKLSMEHSAYIEKIV